MVGMESAALRFFALNCPDEKFTIAQPIGFIIQLSFRPAIAPILFWERCIPFGWKALSDH
jgi:hypothetical protein